MYNLIKALYFRNYQSLYMEISKACIWKLPKLAHGNYQSLHIKDQSLHMEIITACAWKFPKLSHRNFQSLHLKISKACKGNYQSLHLKIAKACTCKLSRLAYFVRFFNSGIDWECVFHVEYFIICRQMTIVVPCFLIITHKLFTYVLV